MQKLFSIAIDGPAGAGKSTVARALAKALGAMYLDTGAMYRAFGLAMQRAGVDLTDAATIAARAHDADITVAYRDGAQRILLDGEDVTREIRLPDVSEAASAISVVPEVREHMVALQRRIAAGHSVIMDGRDIGTVVLPDATLKLYLTASVEARARRRCDELERKGTPEPYEQVVREIAERDHRDMNREASPLRIAPDARIVDTTDMSLEEVVGAIERMARDVIG